MAPIQIRAQFFELFYSCCDVSTCWTLMWPFRGKRSMKWHFVAICSLRRKGLPWSHWKHQCRLSQNSKHYHANFFSSWDHLPFFALKFRWLSFHCSVVADLGLLGFPVLTKWPNSANGAEEVDNYPSNQIQDSKENIYQLKQPWNWEKRRTLLVEANRLYICVDIHLYDMYIF